MSSQRHRVRRLGNCFTGEAAVVIRRWGLIQGDRVRCGFTAPEQLLGGIEMLGWNSAMCLGRHLMGWRRSVDWTWAT